MSDRQPGSAAAGDLDRAVCMMSDSRDYSFRTDMPWPLATFTQPKLNKVRRLFPAEEFETALRTGQAHGDRPACSSQFEPTPARLAQVRSRRLGPQTYRLICTARRYSRCAPDRRLVRYARRGVLVPVKGRLVRR